MNILWSYPEAIVLLFFLGGIVYLHRTSVIPLSPNRRWISFVLRAAFILCLTLALMDPRWLGESRQATMVWLIDGSDSVGGSALEKARKLWEEWESPRPDKIYPVIFGESVYPVNPEE